MGGAVAGGCGSGAVGGAKFCDGSGLIAGSGAAPSPTLGIRRERFVLGWTPHCLSMSAICSTVGFFRWVPPLLLSENSQETSANEPRMTVLNAAKYEFIVR